ncbi:hypothetical protein [Rhodococcus marinonascens]|uniref:hypothetical protein n=1 Tax=Rhodococcus marinonascens TaxID=38311 RepID=UPI000933175E|nr:hypothetical protein [Rhodococcus marinonascens]
MAKTEHTSIVEFVRDGKKHWAARDSKVHQEHLKSVKQPATSTPTPKGEPLKAVDGPTAAPKAFAKAEAPRADRKD